MGFFVSGTGGGNINKQWYGWTTKAKLMKRAGTIFLAYFPIVFLCLQILANIWYLIDFNGYARAYFYLGWALGNSFMVALLLIVLTERLKSCEVSKWAARAQMAFSIVYLIIRQDNIYNVSLQIIIGLVALILTAIYYKDKFPFCRLSLFLNFMKNVFKERSCEKGVASHDRETKNLIIQKKYRHENSS